MTLVVHAQAQQQTQGQFVSLSGIDSPSKGGSTLLSGIFTADSLQNFVNKLFFFAISIGGILAVFQLARAGWLYMLGDNGGNMQKAKDIIGNVVIGVLLLLSIWLILNQINPNLLNLDILRNLNSGGGGTPAGSAQGGGGLTGGGGSSGGAGASSGF